MKALNLHGVNDLRYDEVSLPQLEEDEVLLKIRACGICGSDIPRVYDKGTYHFPTIIGHEFAGQIVKAADKNLLGRKASVFPLLPCGKCSACEEGQYALCKYYSYYGSRQNGGMAEFLAVKVKNLCFLPDDIPYEWGAMSEPAAVAYHAFRKSGAGVGDSIFIYGIGTIGLLIAQWAKAAGVQRIVLAGRTQEKLNLAEKMGFVSVKVNRIKDIQDISACIEGTGSAEGLEACLQVAANFGKVVLLGNPEGNIELSQKHYWQILRKELHLLGTWNSRFSASHNDWRQAVEGMKSGILDLDSLITHRFSLADYKKAFTLMREKREPYLKVMLLIGSDEDENRI